LPEAKLRPRRRWSYIWLLPLAAIATAAWLLISAFYQRGMPIEVTFQQGYGLKHGDALRYRVITVGQVQDVALAENLA
jgi:paraquat-inducible protein B